MKKTHLTLQNRCSIIHIYDATSVFGGESVDYTNRQMTKIAREVSKSTVQRMKTDGIGTAEFDFIHLLRHHPGMTQKEIREALNMDKGVAARRAASLEAKGFLVRKNNPADGRSRLLYATDKAETLRNSKASIEQAFYDWLLSELPEPERTEFCRILNELYLRSKRQARAGFPDVIQRMEEEKVGESHEE